MDTIGYGVDNDLHPQEQPTSITVSNSNLTDKNVTLSGPRTVPQSPPQLIFAIPGNNGNELAQSYNVYWRTKSDQLNHWDKPGGGRAL